MLDSRGESPGAPATGRALSPPFRAAAGQRLELWLGGTQDDRSVGVRLVSGAEVLREWHPEVAGMLLPVEEDLGAWDGREVRVCAFDDSGEAGGYVMLDDVVVLEAAALGEP